MSVGMYFSQQICYIATISVLLVRFAAAWSTPGLAADLIWPPVSIEGYLTQDGESVAPNLNTGTFPCPNQPQSIVRTLQHDFPVTGASLQYDLYNTSVQRSDWKFVVDAYLGQFSNDATSDNTSWTYINTWSYDDITSGSQCTDPINITNQVVTAPDFDLQLAGADSSSLVGVSVTLGLRIVLFSGDENQEEMYQCSFLNLVAEDAPITESRGVCNPGPAATISSGSSSTATAMPTATTTISANDSPVNHPHHQSSTDGVVVGASVGAAALLLLVIGIFLARRKHTRKALRSSSPEESDHGVGAEAGKHKGELVVTTKNKGNRGDDVSVGGSDLSEPPPAYQRENQV